MMRTTAALMLVLLTVGVFLWWSFGLVVQRRVPSASDQSDIQALIQDEFVEIETACLESNHGSEATYKQQQVDYWSVEDPDATVEAARVIRRRMLYPTPDPTFVAADAATMVAEGMYGAGTAVAVLNYQNPTPRWSPGDSPLEQAHTYIDECQSYYGVSGKQTTAFELGGIEYVSIEVNGGDATARAEISYTETFNDSGHTTEGATDTYDYHLVRENGEWRIRNKSLVLTP
jgi:hypothetical protein